MTGGFAADWPELLAAVQTFQRPLFTIGLEPLRQAAAIPPHQHWLARCLEAKAPNSPQLTILGATGPFTLEAELALLRDWRIDVLVAKNSGGDAVAAKLAARQLHAATCAARMNFCILPVEVLGSGPNTTVRGTLNRAS
jgi:precorrin-6x reductase